MNGPRQRRTDDCNPGERGQGADQLLQGVSSCERACDGGEEAGGCALGKALVEVVVLLPNRQLKALERAAASRGVTTGHLLRLLIRTNLASLDARTADDPGSNSVNGTDGRNRED